MTALPPQLQLNDIVLDTVQQALRRGDDLIQLEPRVFDVLCYLLAHRERYVSLQELHQQVWAGRVVSDTAVRRTISKLRAQLQDTNLEQPVFIRSGMKRGYQWLVEPKALQPEAKQAPALLNVDATTAANPELAGKPQPVLRESGRNPRFSMRKASLVISLLLVLVFTVLWWLSGDQAEGLVASDYEVILRAPGAKGSMSVSQNGDWLAFIGMLDNDHGQSLYLLNTQTGAMHRIASGVFPEFVQNDRYLLYGMVGEEPALFLQSLADLSSPPQKLDTSEFAWVGYPVALGEQDVLLSATHDLAGSLTYFNYHLPTGVWTPFNHNHRAGFWDMKARVSPDGQKLALFRFNPPEVETQILVYDTVSRVLLQSLSFPRYFFNLEWLDNQELVLTADGVGDFLFHLDLATEQVKKIAVSSSFVELRRSGQDDWFGLYAPNVEAPRFHLAPLSQYEGGQRIISFSGQPVGMSFSHDPDMYWLVKRATDNFDLYSYQAVTGQKELVFSYPHWFKVLDQHPEQALLLLRTSNRLAILNFDTGDYYYISSAEQNIFDGYFQPADHAVYFSEKASEQWQVSRFDLEQHRQSVLLRGYRYLAPWQAHFIAVDHDGKSWLLDGSYARLEPLPLQYSDSTQHLRLFLQQDTLFAINYTSNYMWQLSQLDLHSLQVLHTDIPVRPARVPWEISVHDGKILHANWSQVSSPVVRFQGPPLQ